MCCQNCRVQYQSANPLPQGEKLPIDQDDQGPGEFGKRTTMEVGVLTGTRIKWASSTYLPQTSPPAMKMYTENKFQCWTWKLASLFMETRSEMHLATSSKKQEQLCHPPKALMVDCR